MPTTRRGYRGWTNEELIVLYEHYPTQGAKTVAQMTGRSIASVLGAARHHQITKAGRAKWQRIPSNEHLDRMIDDAYSSGKLGAVKSLAQRIDRPYGWIRHRALALGCRPQRFKSPDWTPEEDSILHEMAGKSLVYIGKYLKARGYQRSHVAIQKRLSKQAINTHDPDLFTAAGLAKLMGCSHHVVLRWIRKGWLDARKEKRLSIHDGQAQNFWITRRSLREFLIARPLDWDHRKVRDNSWLVEMLAGRVGMSSRSERTQDHPQDPELPAKPASRTRMRMEDSGQAVQIGVSE